MNPKFFDDLEKVNARRKSVGLNSLQKQIEIIGKQVLQENQKPPDDLKERSKKANEWGRKVWLDRIEKGKI